MQPLEIISVNIWQILISLCNLLILFLLLKKFLYAPVRKMLASREAKIAEQYTKAETAKSDAETMQAEWQNKMASAKQSADDILKAADEEAERSKAAILEETRVKADRILRQAEIDAQLEKDKAQAEIKKEIVDVSTALSEKMLGREITVDDHRHMIDTFLAEIGEGHDGNE